MILRTLTLTVTIETTGPPELLAVLTPLFLSGAQAPPAAVVSVPGPPPVVPGDPAPPPARTFLSRTRCPRGHHETPSGEVLRYRGSNTCVTCAKAYPPRRRARTNGQHPPPAADERVEERPTLPPHLAQTAFLSPIVCELEAHRYRESRCASPGTFDRPMCRPAPSPIAGSWNAARACPRWRPWRR